MWVYAVQCLFAYANTHTHTENEPCCTFSTQIDYYIITGVHAKELWNVIMVLTLSLPLSVSSTRNREKNSSAYIDVLKPNQHNKNQCSCLVWCCRNTIHTHAHTSSCCFYFVCSFALLRLLQILFFLSIGFFTFLSMCWVIWLNSAGASCLTVSDQARQYTTAAHNVNACWCIVSIYV